MSQEKGYRVAIIEASELLAGALKRELDSDPEFGAVVTFGDMEEFEKTAHANETNIIVVNPALISTQKRHQVRVALKEYENTTLIALIYSYVRPEVIDQFDGSLDIFESVGSITTKLKNFAEKKRENRDKRQDSITLTDREIEILISVAQGLINKEIADRHNISIHTVISHRKNISRKTGIRTVSGLTVYAMINNLLEE